MELIGKTTINPIIFYTGKISGYITWVYLIWMFFELSIAEPHQIWLNRLIAVIVFIVGIAFVTISLIDLGKSTRLGLPNESTALKTNGIYRISRNPMYLGFNLITISSILYIFNIYVILLGFYSLIVYHFIILGEERFLRERFGETYEDYHRRVRQYI